MKSRKQLKVAVIVLFVAVCGVFFLKKEPEEPAAEVILLPEEVEPPKEEPVTSEEVEKALVIMVHVCGAVKQEGVYTFEAGARVVDAIQAAGGLKSEAAGAALNQAALLVDGMQLYVPSEEEWKAEDIPITTETGKTTGTVGNGLVNINQADRSVLMTLPGIGASKADDILAYREQHGPFQSVDEIMQIPGIKEGVFKKIEQLITVGG